VFCPRCGAESEKGARYCASCGADLPRADKTGSAADAAAKQEPTGTRERLNRVIGTTRKARIATLGTATAIAIAIAAFVALAPSDDETAVPQDAYTRKTDVNCVEHKQQIADAQQLALESGGTAGAIAFADALVPIAGEWRDDLDGAAVPADRVEAVDTLDTALLAAEVQAGTLARVAREGDREAMLVAAGGVDEASRQVEAAVEALELERCQLLTVSVGTLVQR
jgi:hypothetical protein